MTNAQMASLRAQHKAFERAGYDGHGRRPLALTARQLRHRRARRWWARVVAAWVREVTG